jgi:hypothetical protein
MSHHPDHHYVIIPHPSSLVSFHPSTTSLSPSSHNYSFVSSHKNELVVFSVNFDPTESEEKLFHPSKMVVRTLDSNSTITSLCYTNHGDTLLATTTSGDLISLGLDLQIQKTRKLHSSTCTGVISLPDSSACTIGNDGIVKKGTLNSNHWEFLDLSSPLTSIVYNSEHNCAVIGTSHGSVMVLNFHTREQLTLQLTNAPSLGGIKSLATAGHFIAASDQTGQVVVWNLKRLREPIARHFFRDPVTNLHFHPMNHSYLFCSTSSGELTMNTVLFDLQCQDGCLWRLPEVYQSSKINCLEIKDSMIIAGTDIYTLIWRMSLEPRDRSVIKDLLFGAEQPSSTLDESKTFITQVYK